MLYNESFCSRQVPKTLPQPEENATEFTFTVNEALNGAKFRCVFDYSQVRQFPSPLKTLKVKRPARFLESKTTDNRNSVAVKLNASTTISCAFEAQPPVDYQTAFFSWKRTLLDTQTGKGAQEGGQGGVRGAQCGLQGNAESRDEELVPDDYTDWVPTIKRCEGGMDEESVTVFSLTIKNFDTDKEGCYTCSLSLPNSNKPLSKSFNLIGKSNSSKYKKVCVPVSLSSKLQRYREKFFIEITC